MLDGEVSEHAARAFVHSNGATTRVICESSDWAGPNAVLSSECAVRRFPGMHGSVVLDRAQRAWPGDSHGDGATLR